MFTGKVKWQRQRHDSLARSVRRIYKSLFIITFAILFIVVLFIFIFPPMDVGYGFGAAKQLLFCQGGVAVIARIQSTMFQFQQGIQLMAI